MLQVSVCTEIKQSAQICGINFLVSKCIHKCVLHFKGVLLYNPSFQGVFPDQQCSCSFLLLDE